MKDLRSDEWKTETMAVHRDERKRDIDWACVATWGAIVLAMAASAWAIFAGHIGPVVGSWFILYGTVTVYYGFGQKYAASAIAYVSVGMALVWAGLAIIKAVLP